MAGRRPPAHGARRTAHLPYPAPPRAVGRIAPSWPDRAPRSVPRAPVPAAHGRPATPPHSCRRRRGAASGFAVRSHREDPPPRLAAGVALLFPDRPAPATRQPASPTSLETPVPGVTAPRRPIPPHTP